MRRQNPVGTVEDLARATARYAHRRGAARLARAFVQVRPGTDSAREGDLRMLLVRAGLPEPVINLRITDAQGELFGDLGYPEWKTIVEYDGRHHLVARQNADDIVRWERLTAAGWTVVRVVNEHLETPDAVIRRVARALSSGGWRPPRSKLHLLH